MNNCVEKRTGYILSEAFAAYMILTLMWVIHLVV